MTKSKFTVPHSAMTFAILFSMLVVLLGGLLPVGTASGGGYLTTLTVSGSFRTQTKIVSSAKSSQYGQAVTFTATVTPVSGNGKPTGKVTFSDGSKKIASEILRATSLNVGHVDKGTQKISGIVSLVAGAIPSVTLNYQLPVGRHNITAVYSGDSNFASSVSNNLTQAVKKATTTTKLLSSANPSVYGQPVMFTATINWGDGRTAKSVHPTGTVQFLDDSTKLGTVTFTPSVKGGETATLTVTALPGTASAGLTAGTHTITAVYAGSRNFAGSVSKKLTEIVTSVAATSTTTTTSALGP